jgi:hypothetical protein
MNLGASQPALNPSHDPGIHPLVHPVHVLRLIHANHHSPRTDSHSGSAIRIDISKSHPSTPATKLPTELDREKLPSVQKPVPAVTLQLWKAPAGSNQKVGNSCRVLRNHKRCRGHRLLRLHDYIQGRGEGQWERKVNRKRDLVV